MTILEEYMPKDPLMQIAWADCLRWAIKEQKIIDQYLKETGDKWTAGRSPLDRMIDEASGADKAFVIRFVQWFNENIWGSENESMPKD